MSKVQKIFAQNREKSTKSICTITVEIFVGSKIADEYKVSVLQSSGVPYWHAIFKNSSIALVW